jgi:hypothetical protein
MARLHRSVAALRISGDDLDPSEITSVLGCEPTKAQRKGQTFTSSAGKTRVAKFGMWLLEAEDRAPEDLDAQITEVLSRLTPSLEAWRSISGRYTIDLFCGFFMQRTNEGLVISPGSLKALSDRDIELGLDLYAPTKEDLEQTVSGRGDR